MGSKTLMRSNRGRVSAGSTRYIIITADEELCLGAQWQANDTASYSVTYEEQTCPDAGLQTDSNKSGGNSSSSNGGAIAGGVIGALALCCCCLLLLLVVLIVVAVLVGVVRRRGGGGGGDSSVIDALSVW